MVEGYHALSHHGDVPVPMLWGMHGLVPALLTAYPSPAPFTRSPSSDTAPRGTDSRGPPHEHGPVLLLLPVCLMLWDMGGGPTEPPFILHLDSLLNTRDSSPSCTQPGPRHLISSPASSLRAPVGLLTPLQVPRSPLPGPSPALTLARDGGAGPAAVRGRRWRGTRSWPGDAAVAPAVVAPAAPASRRAPPAAAFMVRRGGPTRGGPPPPRLWSGAQPCSLPTPGPTLPHCTLGQNCSCPKPCPSPSRRDLSYPGQSLPAVRLDLPRVPVPPVTDAPPHWAVPQPGRAWTFWR